MVFIIDSFVSVKHRRLEVASYGQYAEDMTMDLSLAEPKQRLTPIVLVLGNGFSPRCFEKGF